jgi:hypothetical protein
VVLLAGFFMLRATGSPTAAPGRTVRNRGSG